MKWVSLAAAGLIALTVGAAARAEAPAKTSVLVRDFKVGEKLQTDGGVLGSSFCVELAKDKQLDVVCQADVAQLLDFQAQRAMQGLSGNAQPVLQRMANVNYVVDGRVVKGKHGLILEVKLAENVNRGDAVTGPVAGEPLASLKHKGIKGGISGVMQRFPALAKRAAALFAPKEAGAPAPPPSLNKDK